MSNSPAPKSKFTRDILRGLGLTFLLHLIQVPLAVVSSGLSFAFVGISQGLYIVPAFIVAGIKTAQA